MYANVHHSTILQPCVPMSFDHFAAPARLRWLQYCFRVTFVLLCFNFIRTSLEAHCDIGMLACAPTGQDRTGHSCECYEVIIRGVKSQSCWLRVHHLTWTLQSGVDWTVRSLRSGCASGTTWQHSMERKRFQRADQWSCVVLRSFESAVACGRHSLWRKNYCR